MYHDQIDGQIDGVNQLYFQRRFQRSLYLCSIIENTRFIKANWTASTKPKERFGPDQNWKWHFGRDQNRKWNFGRDQNPARNFGRDQNWGKKLVATKNFGCDQKLGEENEKG